MSLAQKTVSACLDEADYEKLMTLALVAGKSPGGYLARRFSSRLTEIAPPFPGRRVPPHFTHTKERRN